MDRYLIESPHAAGDCKKVLESVYAQGYLNNFDWGCMSGNHTGWVIIEAENESQALWVVPHFIRSKAKATRLVKFDRETADKFEAH